MVAELVQHQQLRAPAQSPGARPVRCSRPSSRQRPPWHRPGAFSACDAVGGQAVAHALAARLVVAPVHRHAGARQHVQQRSRCRGCAPRRSRADRTGANMHGSETSVLVPQLVTSREVDHRHRASSRRGLPRVAVQAPVGGSRRLAHHQHQQQRLAPSGPARPGLSVRADRLARRARAARVARASTLTKPPHTLPGVIR